MITLGRLFFRFRNTVFPLLIVFALLVCTPVRLLNDAGSDAWMDIAGVLVALLGLVVRGMTIGYEYIVRGGRNRRVYADTLVQGGVYAHTRNPMYLGNGLLVLGCALIINAPEFYLVALPLTVLAYGSIIAAEEAYLRDKFGGEFDAYCRRVNRIVPGLAGWRRSMAGMRFNWRRLIVKEYNTIFGAVAAVTALSVWDDYRIVGEQALPSPRLVLTLAIPWLAGYVVVWGLKKTRRLQAEAPRSGTSA
jgi:protein-S-isoprenylcysteine O-methyltransferase Ste14